MIAETSREALIRALNEQEVTWVLFHTPLCGTCKVARRMLDIIVHMRRDIDICACNLNVMPDLAQTWQIQSVPCLIRLRNGQPDGRLYAFSGVDTVLDFLGPPARDGAPM